MYVARTYEQKRDKADLAASARRAGQAARMEAAYVSAAVKLMEALEAEIAHREFAMRVAETKQRIVSQRTVKPVEVLTPALNVKPVTMKLRQKGVTRTRANQPETRVDGFEGLAMLLEHRAA
jgi:hypothetical protein